MSKIQPPPPKMKKSGLPKPTPEEIRSKEEEAEKKLAEQIKVDQKWVDKSTTHMSPQEKEELFRQLSRKCEGTTYIDGKIVLACPIKPRLINCVDADPFDCPGGTTGNGCALSSEVSEGLKTDKICIDAVFVSQEEGGSYLSPYIPWGPIGRDKKGRPVVTQGNHSGVTIGTGVDLGAMKAKDLERLRKAGVSQVTLDKMKPLLGMQGADACKALRELKGDKPLVFDAGDVQKIDQDAFQSRVAPLKKSFDARRDKYIAECRALINKENKKKNPDDARIEDWQNRIEHAKGFDDLSCTDQTVLFSTYYHEGSIQKKKRKDMQQYADALITGDPAAARNAIELKTESNNNLISRRGKEELEYWNEHTSQPGESVE